MRPTNTLLIGDPLSGQEARFLRTLYADLEPIGALILANFHCGPSQIDFVVVTESFVAVLELKHLSGPVFGQQNGRWMLGRAGGQRMLYPGPNPWHQTLKQKFALSDEMKHYAANHHGVAGPTGAAFFAEFAAFVCIVPAIDPRSQITPGDSRVAVRSYSDVLESLRSGAKPASWTRSDWTRFATEHLALTAATLEEATDPNVRVATDAVRSYVSRIAFVFGFGLAPLLPVSSAAEGGQPLIDEILAGDNHLVVGPSGSAKTFHLHHAAMAIADRGNEIPVLVESKTYRGGDFWSLLRRGIAPMFTGDPKELLSAIRLCGLWPVLLVDAVNECPGDHLEDLLRGVQAFALHFDARVVITAQAAVDLPDDLKAVVHRLKTPNSEQKRQIYCYHAGIGASSDVDYFCEGFTNAYELTVAGRCHVSGRHAASRADLFDRYVATCLPERYHVATALLRCIASEMAPTVSSSWERSQYELFAERFLVAQGSPLAILDDLRRCRLIRLTDEFFSFEHDLLADYFNASELHRRYAGSPELAVELRKPRNQRLIELVLPRLADDDDITAVLSASADTAVLNLTLAGRCGPRAKAVLLGHIQTLFTLATHDLSNLTCACHISQEHEGRRRLLQVSVEGNRLWSAYCGLLCELVAHNLDEPTIAKEFIELLDVTEWSLRRAAEQAAAASRIKPHRVWEQVVWRYGGGLNSSAIEIPCATILAEIRTALMDREYPNGSPVRDILRERAVSVPEGHLALLALFHDTQGIDHDDVETNVELIRRGWNSNVSTIRLEALHFLQWMRHAVGESSSVICEMLNGFKTDNIFENTVLLETLSLYGGLECGITSEDALREMRSTITPGAMADPKVAEVAKAFDADPYVFLASQANSCLSKIFEDIFQGVYWEAYAELSGEEKCAILSLASTCPDVRFHSDWILRELLAHGGRDALPVYRRLAGRIDGACSCAQDATASFLLAVQGCARWTDKPPAYTGDDTPSHRAWATLGEIFFWIHRKALVPAVLWSRFEGATRLAAGDVLFHLEHCGWKLREGERPLNDLISAFPGEIRPIVEDCIRGRASLPTVFNFGGSHNPRVVSYLIEVLGRIGTDDSIRLLQELVDDLELGKNAINAIGSIRKAAIQSTA